MKASNQAKGWELGLEATTLEAEPLKTDGSSVVLEAFLICL
jgi:hypothetical protein